MKDPNNPCLFCNVKESGCAYGSSRGIGARCGYATRACVAASVGRCAYRINQGQYSHSFVVHGAV